MSKSGLLSTFFVAAFLLVSLASIAQPVFTLQNKKDACNALQNGSFDINVTSATGAISAFVFSSGPPIGPLTLSVGTPFSVTNLKGSGAGVSYLVVVSDDNGSNSSSATILLYSNVSVVLTSKTDVTTCTPFNGAIDITPSGGSGNYTYTWTGPSGFVDPGTQDLSNIASGSYSVVVNDANTHCSANLGPIVINTASPSISLGSIPGVCSGTTTSTLSYSATTGSPDQYTIDWDATANAAGLTDVGLTALPASPITISNIPAAAATYNGLLYARNSATGCISASNAISVTVTANVTPSVSIAASPGTSICAGVNVTFTATPTNGGGAPTYQWKKNGVNVGVGGATYSDAALANGDVISVVMTSSLVCVTTPTATSNTLTMTVTANVTPSVVISASPGSSICSGVNVTFTAVPTNGGGAPTYQWKKNGVNVGAGGTTYSNAALANGDVISVVMTSSIACVTSATATSNTITMTVTPTVTPSVSIAASPGTSICAGVNVTFTATPTNGGGAPTYQWKKNGVNVGVGGATYSDAALVNGDVISVVMTSSLACVTSATATSNTITMTVTALPTITLGSIPGVCSGTTSSTLTYSATTGSPTQYSIDWDAASNAAGLSDVALTALPASPITISNIPLAAATYNGLLYVKNTVTGCTSVSNPISVTVTANVTPSVSISASPGSSICAGVNVTFTATPTNGGGAPTYQWKKNGVNVGTGGTTYSDAALANGDVISVVMTSSIVCVTSPTATSNTITMTVTPNVTPSVSISASPGSSICAGVNVTFTAVPTNGGGSPTYQWKKNGVNVGAGGTTYSDATLANGDVISVVLTSSLTCVTSATATSNTITMTVTPNVTPSVAISASPGSSICAGVNVTFTATPTNGGGAPTYQWKKNGVNVGTGGTTYSDAALVNGDVISVVLTSSLTCVTSATASSNTITMTVTAIVTPSVSIAAAPGSTICSGTNVTFTATPTNGGGSPTYQWKKNGSNVGAGGTTYSDAALANGDVISVVLTSSLTCVTSATATSNTVTMTVNAIPTATIAASPSPICAGSSSTLTFTLTGTGPFNVTYTDGVTPVNLVGISTGHTVNVSPAATTTYTITAVADANCTGAAGSAATVTVNPSPTSAVLSGDNTICKGTSTDLTVTIVGGTSPYSFTINNGVGSVTSYVSGTAIPVSPLATVTYSIVGNVTDANGCSVVPSGSAFVTVNTAATPTITGPSVACLGSTGNNYASDTGMSGYTWTVSAGGTISNNNGDNVDIDWNAAGPQTVSVSYTDGSGCVTAATVYNVNVANLTVTPTITDNTRCIAPFNGAISLAITGAVGPLTIAWTTPGGYSSSSQNISNLPPDSYDVTVTDPASGCSVSLSVLTVNDNSPAITVTQLAETDNDKCTSPYDGSLTISTSGSLGVPTFSWTGPGGFTSTSQNISALNSGNYDVTVTDPTSGCSVLQTFVVGDNTPVLALSTSPTDNSNCVAPFNGAIDLTVVGGGPNYTYAWTKTASPYTASTQNIAALSSGSYDVTVTDVTSGCTATLTGTVINDSPTQITADVSATATICSGQSTNLTFTLSGAGPTYDITYTDGTTNFLAAGVVTGGTVSVSPTTSVSYTIVSVKDNGSGCVLTAPDPNITGSGDITVNPSPTGSISGTVSLCPGQSTNLTFTLPAGTFDVVYTDGTSNFTLAGISTGATASVTPAITTTYTIFSITDNTNGCVVTAPSPSITGSAVVTIYTTPTADISGPSAVCSGSSANLSVAFTGTSPWTFSFTDGTTTFNNVSSIFTPFTIPITPSSNTTYTLLSVKDANCAGTLGTSTVTVNVDTPPTLTLGVTAAISPLCTGGSTTIDVANSEIGVSYQLRDASNTNIGTAANGNGGTLSLPTGALAATTTFNVLATRGVCTPAQLNNTATVTVGGTINQALTVTPLAASVCTGSSTTIQVAASENGVTYQLRDNSNNALIGSAVPGTGAVINLPTGNLSSNTTFNILAASGSCSVQLTNLATVNVDINPNIGLTVGAVLNPLCTGGSTQVTVSLSEVGVSYQLRDHLNNSVGAAVAGTGGTINLPTGVLNSNETFNVLATSGACVPVQLTNTVAITVSGTINAGLTVTPVSSTICSGSNADIQVAASEVGVNYQLVNSATNANVGSAVAGTGATIDLFANGLIANTSFYIVASNGSCSIQLTNTASITVSATPNLTLATSATLNPVCTGASTNITVANSELNVSYQLRDASNTNIGTPVVGTGGTINLPTGALAANTTFNVLATSGTCTPAQLTNTVAVTVGGSINTGLTVAASPATICSGTATFVQVQNSEVGVNYQLRDNATNTAIGGVVAGTGATINLSTGNINATTTYNVLGSTGTCSAQLTNLATVTVNMQPNSSLTVTAQNGSVCTGTGTNIQVAASEVGVSYQLRDNSNNNAIGSAVAGTGASINLPTGNLSSTTTFNVLATGGGTCTAQLTSTVSVTVLLATDPLCSGGGGGTGTCATVVITPTPSPATCTNSDGQINFVINPAVPAVNNVGVSITIQGISTTNNTVALTNFNNPLFTNIPVGVYTYSIIYGDPSCTKSGQVTVDQSGTVGTPVATNPINATCYGSATGAVTLDVPGETGNLLQWSVDGVNWNNFTAGNQITGIPAGAAPSFTRVISVRRNSSDPCNASVSVTISQPADIATTFTVQDASCTNNDGTIQVGTITGGTGAYTYRLDSVDYAALPNANTFTGLSGGIHKFTIIDANGCSKYFKVTVNFPGLVNFTTLVTGPDCSGSGNNGSVVATITSSGTFNIGITTDPINDPTTMQTVVSAGSTPVTFSGLSQGIYYVVAKPSGALCPTRTLVSISGGPTAVDFSLKAKNYTCFETPGEVNVYGIKGLGAVNYSYEILSQGNVVLSGTITQLQALDSVFLSPLTSGSYQIHLFQDQSATSGCAAPISSAFKSFSISGATATLDTLFITRTPSLLNHPTGSMQIGIKESGEQPYQVMLQLIDPQIQGQKNHQAFDSLWVNVPRNNTTLKIEFDANNLYAGDYRLFIRDTLGCVKTYDLVNNRAYIGFDQKLFIPNIFTPNNDGKNETFYIINLPATGATLVITNRWGKEVFQSSNYNNKWDGGAESDGVYFYRLSTGGQVFTGWVEILRSTTD
ncbi:MAG: gliding motility-associated C-terminal domain-containing protein [Bacteroidetes bacterium]|nr:gliding motility-associated C-terminal domain-containing protein [Bacteroidota bacterium]